MDGKTFSYKVESYDAAGNSDTSACSTAMAVDITPPDAVDSALWTGSITVSNIVGVTADWVDATPSADLKEYRVDFYDGANRAIPMPACRPQSLADIGKSSCSQVAAILKGFFRMCPIGISVGTGYSKMLSADQDVFP